MKASSTHPCKLTDVLIIHGLFKALKTLGVLESMRDLCDIEEMRKQFGIPDKYRRLWGEIIQILIRAEKIEDHGRQILLKEKYNLLEKQIDSIDLDLEADRLCESYPLLKPQLDVLIPCLKELPKILTGRKQATEVLFAHSSMERVEAIYKEHPSAEYFNLRVADVVTATVEKALPSLSQGEKIHILEIGAGTGGTSTFLFKALNTYSDKLRYIYTDISKRFLIHAEETFCEQYSFIETQLLNIEQAVAEQGFEPASIDIVVAANVLHATRNISRTLENVKTLLKCNGLLVLNELTEVSPFLTVTFGLLDGWWLYDDETIRLPGSPALSAKNWQLMLEKQHFHKVILLDEKAQALGQQIIIAQNDDKTRDAPLITHKVATPINPVRQQVKAPLSSIEIAASVEASLMTQLSLCIKIEQSRLNTHTTFSDYGVDSILMLAFVDKINQALGINLNPSELFNYTTVERLTEFIVDQYRNELPTLQQTAVEQTTQIQENKSKIKVAEKAKNKNPDTARSNSPDNSLQGSSDKQDLRDIAIIGMSGQFPGANNTQEFWQNLQAGINSVGELPESRLDSQMYSPQPEAGKCYCKWGGILEEQSFFDPLFFEISPKEAAEMNPSQRVFMQEAYRALEDAGIVNEGLSQLQCGIYVGCEPNSYVNQGFTGSSEALVASRISYFLNLQGPALVINSGCSSSLVAIHLACESLRHGENDIALAGGVFTNLNSELLVCLSSIEMLSSSGKCRTFDEAANGTVLCEGVSVVVLKKLQDALDDGDLIYGVIKGSGINQDGRSNGITAPNGLAQEKLIKRIYQNYNIDASKISYIEAHGTGTKLGDPVEANALKKVFSRSSAESSFRCGVGSVKSNIGHAAAAAGAIALIKVLLCMKHRQLTSLVHFNKLNPLIDFNDTGLYIVEQLQDWETQPGEPLMAGINSFGHSGTNAHLVIQEAPVQTLADSNKPFYLICLSAKTDEALKYKISDLSEYLAGKEKQGTLGAIAYTLNTGRAHFKKRCAFVVDSLEALQDALTGTLDGLIGNGSKMSPPEQAFSQKVFDLIVADLQNTGNLESGVDQTTYKDNLIALAGLYLKGFDLDWQRIYKGQVYRRLSLPTYPFAKDAYWINKPTKINFTDTVAPKRETARESHQPNQKDQATLGGQFYLPQWKRLEQTRSCSNSDRAKPVITLSPVVIFYSPTMSGVKDDIKKCYEQGSASQVISFELGDTPSSELNVSDRHAFEFALASPRLALEALLEQGQAPILYFIMPEPDQTPGFGLNLQRLEDNQSLGLIALFRLIQALLGYHCYSSELTLKIVTQQTQACRASERIAPYGADVVGFVQSLTKEYDLWHVSCVDINRQTLWTPEQSKNFASALTALKAPTNGCVLCWREGHFYENVLTQANLARVEGSSFKTHGVYLIIGGAGGLGLVLSQYLLETVQGKLVWVGRRSVEALEPKAQQLLKTHGADVLYQQADLCDLEAMQRVVQQAKAHFGHIDGVIHSALVLEDRAIADMDEKTLHKVLSPKVQGNVVLQQVLNGEPLDFLLFFSAGQSFMSHAGQSNYAAACTFEDAWGQCQNQQQKYPVKIINWGYWGEVGIVATANHRQRMARQGVLSINPQEGMEVVERCLASYATQVAYFKAQPSALSRLGLDNTGIMHPCQKSASPALIYSVIAATQHELMSLQDGQRYQQTLKKLDRLGYYLLLRAFQTMGVFCQPGEYYEQQALASRLGILESYHQLYKECLNLLENAGFIEMSGLHIEVKNTLPKENDEHQNWLKSYPELRSHEKLLRICLQAYPDIIRGFVAATDIIFPEASMELVEGIYQGNTAANALNTKARDAAVAYVKARLSDCQKESGDFMGSKIIFLEVGAGTGGMSSEVLKGLAPYGEYIEYYYTDISEHFVQYGRRRYGEDYPFVLFQRLDIEQERQGLSHGLPSACDVVLAANVLHATQSIRNTIQHVKALLKRHGLLILNEVTTITSFATLTFGLLEGWWRYQDAVVRMPGGPLLSAPMWYSLLEEEGFDHVVSLGEQREGEMLGQQIIVGQSDGWSLRKNTQNHEIQEKQSEPKISDPAIAITQVKNPYSPAQLVKKVTAQIVQALSEALDIASTRVELDVPFSEYGVDSILSVSIINQLNQRLGIRLKRPDLFNYTTTESMAAHIVETFEIRLTESIAEKHSAVAAPKKVQAAVKQDHPPQKTQTPQRILQTNQEPIAVIGMSACLPGADNVQTFWDNLAGSKNSVTQIPRDRWQRESVNDLPGAPDISQRQGGFMDNIAEFDPLFFAISPQEAQWMDPQQRLFLQQAWAALEDAGYNPRALEGTSCAVFVGCSATGYGVKEGERAGYVPYAMTNSDAILPARISYFLDLKGPSIPINTACSSSLVAIHLACEQLRSGQSDIALAGGASALIGSALHIGLKGAGMLSADGRCKAFDRGANGFVLGEAVGVVVLKPLSLALADGDSIHGLIIGSAINQDGKTNGIMAPNGPSQTALIESVYRKFQIDPNTISYIETHGTGTQLGDPIEVNALADAYKKFTTQTQYCAIGSVKTNIGHTTTAAGVCGLIKTLLCLKNKKLVPSLHYNQPNENIEFAQTAFYVNTQVKDWVGDRNGIRRAAVSSFGYSGTNAHMVVEEFLETRTSTTGEQEPALIVLSGRNEARLKNLASNLRGYLNKDRQVQLADVAYTLQVGRQAMSERLAFVADSVTDIVKHLADFVDGKVNPQDLYRGTVKSASDKSDLLLSGDAGQAFMDTILKQQDYRKLAALWVAGTSLDWNLLYGENRPRRISLPSYPFARESYWLDEVVEAKAEDLTTDKIKRETPTTHIEQSTELMTFEEVWQEQPLSDASSSASYKSVVYFLSQSENQQAMLKAMQAIDPTINVIFIAQGDTYAKHSSHTYTVDPVDTQSYGQVFTDISQNHGNVDALLYLWAIEDSRCLYNPNAIAYILQSLGRSALKPSRLLLLASFSTALERCYLESWLGFDRSLKLIMPGIQVTGLYLENLGQGETISMREWSQNIFSELKTPKAQTVLIQKHRRYVCQIQKTVLAIQDASVIKPGGTYLITGGCGGLGFLVAQHLAQYSVPGKAVNLILTGRSFLDEKIQSKLGQLEKLGANIYYIKADICDAIAMRNSIAQAKNRFGDIHGIFHIAGIAASATILDKNIATFEKVLEPKVAGTLMLDDLCRDEPLDFICYFSSSAAILGDFGACDYAIGNRFQMAYAAYRNQLQQQGMRQGKALVINWPLWREGGMGFNNDENTKMYLQSSGQRVLETQEGLAVLDKILSQNKTQHLVLVGQPSRVYGFLGLTQAPLNPSPVNQTSTRQELRGLSLEQSVLWDLKNIIVHQLKIPWEQLERESNLADFGFDSISLLSFATRLGEHYQLEITPALFFGYSTLEQLTQYFLREHSDFIQAFYQEQTKTEVHSAQAEESAYIESLSEEVPPEKTDDAIDEPIAIIGMSGRFPKSYDIEEMWNILAQGECAVEEIPQNYFDWRRYYGDPSQDANKTNGKWCACIPGVAEFDPLFFQISPREAANIDPRQRHLLQESWNALENAGYGTHHINNQKIGTFVGAEEGDYSQRVKEGNITSNHSGILAARLAYFLNLKGPTMMINTACSSSLVATHQACLSLRQRECDTAIAAGVNLMLTPYGYIGMAQAGMLSSDGRCYAFDQRANGLVPGEAVVVVVLKRLSRALTDGDPIHGVILASGVNYDGKTNGITAPSGVSQTELVKDVYRRARVSPQNIDYIVTHGTGTKLGDPVELNALAEVFKGSEHPCAITSSKTNFGHTFSASGLVSLVSLVQALRHETIPKSLHFAQQNDFVSWDKSPLYVNTVNQPWTDQPGKKRIGAVSAFGMSGTNAHMLVQGYRLSRKEQPIAPPYSLLVLSAKTEDAVQLKVKAMIQFFQEGLVDNTTLADISYTLFEGRHHLQYRLAIVVQDIADAIYTWTQSGQPDKKPNIFQGKVPTEFSGQKVTQNYVNELLQKIRLSSGDENLYRENLFGLADFYCQGYDIPWSTLYGDTPPRRINLPGYPFSRQHFWLDFSPQSHGEQVATEISVAEPLKKTLKELSYLLKWEQQPQIETEIKTSQVVLLVYFESASQFEKTLANFFQQQCASQVFEIQLGLETKQVSEHKWHCDVNAPTGFQTCLEGYSHTININSFYFICSDRPQHSPQHSIPESEIQLLRLVKALKQHIQNNAFIDCTLLTLDNYRVDNSVTSPNDGGISGLGYSVAQGDHRFRVRNIDLSQEDLASAEKQRTLPAMILSEAPSDRGEVTKLQSGLRYKQRFFKLDWQSLQGLKPQAGLAGLKVGGVYVLMGGAGTVGTIITRYLIQKYQAKVVWLGRRPLTSAAMQEKLQAFQAMGERNAPLYIQADVTDRSSMAQAVKEIKQHYTQINGAIFSPLVFKFDNSIAHTSEAEFNEVLDTKKKGAAYFHTAFKNEALDFMCYFSSVQAFSFLSSRDSAGYAAGITSADTFVHSIDHSVAFPVGIINWGYWHASLAGTDAEKRLAGHYDLISDHEGCQFFDEFIPILRAGLIKQTLCLGVSKAVEGLMGCDPKQMITLNKPGADSLIHCLFNENEAHEEAEIARLLDKDFRNELHDWLPRLLFLQIRQLGIFLNGGEQKESTHWQKQAGVIEKYGRWWHECCLGLLENYGYVQCKGDRVQVATSIKVDNADKLWQDWENYQNLFLHKPEKKAALELLDTCLRKLPQILRGNIQATDILFPKSSMEKVENMYQRNSLSDYFNTFVAKTAEAYIRQRIQADPQTKIRILEIGAGTGGTTALVLPQLRQVQHAIDEYCYTDLSKAFLMHAEKNYGQDYSYLNYKLLNIEQAIAPQGIESGTYDIVIATNVLHATKNIRQTLRHTKTALKRNGLLLLNEVVEKSIIGTLTFGLLDGWWLYQDEELRIPGSPLIELECWLKILKEEGFTSTLLPAQAAYELGQQVMVAESDGFVRRKRSPLEVESSPKSAVQEVPLTQEQPLAPRQPVQDISTETLQEHVSKLILKHLAETLDMAQGNIDPQISFSDYGIDSILGVGFIDQLAKALGITMNTAILFDYTNVTRLSHYLVDTYAEKIQNKLQKNRVPAVEQNISTYKVETLQEVPLTQEQPLAPRQPVQNISAETLQEHVSKLILKHLAETLDMAQGNIDPQISFSDYGIDSILGVGFIDQLAKALGITMNTAILFDYTNVTRLSHYLVDTYAEKIQNKLQKNRVPAVEQNISTYKVENKPENPMPKMAFDEYKAEICKAIAVIGMSGQFPGAKDLDTFWQNLIQGHDGVAEFPANYLNPDLFSPHKQAGKTDCKWGGILEQRDCFDPLFFNITPREAESMNPHQRLILSESWKALEDAGYNPKDLENSRASVFIGAEPTDYIHETFTGSSDAIVASRLSYFLNLKGPALVVNTGCSSSALAIHLACESLRSGESSMALAGGIFAAMHEKALVKLAEIDMLSSTGRCRTFDKSCDGTVLSEGVGVVVLKRLNDAIRDKDPIYGVIQASGANHDGASNGITAPSGLSQEELLTSVYRQYQINPETISYVEAHGTGTRLGDTVEANALKRAFKQFSDRTQFCALGSAKSHIGHTGAASGVIGLIKILLSMRHRQLPKMLHFEELNPAIALDNSAFYINNQQVEWTNQGNPLTAALNSFGHSGTNVHLVVREHLSVPQVKVEADSVLVPLSAKTPECLKAYAKKLAAFLENRPLSEEISLTDLAFTLQLGREAMRERCIFLTRNIPDLIAQLNAFASSETLNDLSWHGRVGHSKNNNVFDDNESGQIIAQWMQKGKLEKVAAAWVQGATIDWSVLYRELTPHKIHVPTYPFAEEHYWKPEPQSITQKTTAPETSPVTLGTLMLQPCWVEQTVENSGSMTPHSIGENSR
ncbi:MAG: SDR family NAD(P)-dependent oxidoreductase [Tolypothrix brevis GSE-NOS-MK-07-07A]|nr:SDR family NAD(P)-dependent oxidoreductase [Tolypothrix brevis GSE-NOS-MK-07-07A]